MKEVHTNIIVSILLFIGSLFLIYEPPVRLFWIILGIFGIIVSLFLLIVDIIIELEERK